MFFYRPEPGEQSFAVPVAGNSTVVRFLAVGDINLGRLAGQKILGGDTLFPFENIATTLKEYDLVFGNLESQLSNQDGETQHPDNNYIFTGPPAGAVSLHRAGFHVVSTANNHALDYGYAGLSETIRYLRANWVESVGTSEHMDSLYRPLLMVRKNIRFAFFACTEIMNTADRSWSKVVCKADTTLLLPEIRFWKDSVDVVIVSFHGGTEYGEEASPGTLWFANCVLVAGAHVFLGHHPHVSYGIIEDHGRLIVPSLGNFVFLQPQRYWAQRSFALEIEFEKTGENIVLTKYRPLPIRCGLQPEFLPQGEEAMMIAQRIQSFSRVM
ncbi:MAG TPA: CapA family protein [Bacteroidota bacterium]